MATPNHYKTLELQQTATQTDIKQAYHRLAKQHHPDSRGREPSDHERIAQINQAYEILGDPAARKRYDGQHGGVRSQNIDDIQAEYQKRRREIGRASCRERV